MNHTNNKSLNDLFRSAEAESEGDVLSQSEVERLLQSAKRSVPVTQSIGQKLSNNLYEHLFSTPLKIGMTAMTTAACITLSIFAFWPQQSTNTVTKSPIMTHRTYESHGTDEATQNISQPTANNTPPANYKSQPNEATAIIPAQPIATADSLQPVELTPEQLAEIGIVLEDNGDIDFYTGSGSSFSDSSYVNHFSLLPSGGVRMHFRAHDGPITLTELHQQNIIPLSPKLITTANGEKRMFFLGQDSPNSHGIVYHSSIKNFPNSNGKTDVQPVFDDDTEMENMVSKSLNPGEIRITNSVDLRNGVPVNGVHVNGVAVPVNSVPVNSVPVNSVPVNGVPVNGVTVNGVQVNDDGSVNIPSVNSQSQTSIELGVNSSIPPGVTIGTSYPISTVNPNGKTIEEVGPGQNVQIVLNSDTNEIVGLQQALSSLRHADSALQKIRQVQVLNVPDDSTNHRLMNITINNLNCNMNIKPKNIDSEYNSFIEDTTEFDHLIPIRVVNLKNAAHPNELIFWYEPSAELTAAMPAAVSPVPAAQSKQLAISVYPNPTMGPATIHYELADAPRAYFSVRNLLGQEMMNGGMTSGTTGDANLDLSQLPAGVYLLITTTDNGERDVERVVVTK